MLGLSHGGYFSSTFHLFIWNKSSVDPAGKVQTLCLVSSSFHQEKKDFFQTGINSSDFDYKKRRKKNPTFFRFFQQCVLCVIPSSPSGETDLKERICIQSRRWTQLPPHQLLNPFLLLLLLLLLAAEHKAAPPCVPSGTLLLHCQSEDVFTALRAEVTSKMNRTGCVCVCPTGPGWPGLITKHRDTMSSEIL